MLGAPSGAVGAANGPQSGSESRISSSILPLNSVAIAGLTLVVNPRDSGCRLHRCAELPANTALTILTPPQWLTRVCPFPLRPGVRQHRHARAAAEIVAGQRGQSGRLLTGLRHRAREAERSRAAIRRCLRRDRPVG